MNIEYICLRCNKSCKNNKTHFRKHLLRKYQCKVLNKNISCTELLEKFNNNEYINYYDEMNNYYKCEFCQNLYKHQSSLINHKKKCIKNFENNSELTNNELVNISKINENNNNNVTNITNNNITNNNNINIQIINPIGRESFDIKEIYQLLSFDPNPEHFHTEDNNHNFSKRMLNYIDNYNIIFDKLLEDPKNHNFQIINKRNKICKIKDSDENKHINFEKLSLIIFNIIDNIYELSIYEYQINNDDQSLNHYIEFKKNLKDRYKKFVLKYKNSTSNEDKEMYYDVLYKFYKGFKDLLKNNEQKIFTKAYDIKF